METPHSLGKGSQYQAINWLRSKHQAMISITHAQLLTPFLSLSLSSTETLQISKGNLNAECFLTVYTPFTCPIPPFPFLSLSPTHWLEW